MKYFNKSICEGMAHIEKLDKCAEEQVAYVKKLDKCF
jgi:hypothetical protein